MTKRAPSTPRRKRASAAAPKNKEASTPPKGAEARLRWLAERGDPVALAIITAPPEDEVLTPHEAAAIRRGLADGKAGRVVKLPPRPARLPQRLRVELDRETDGRWIADVPALPGVHVYGATVVEAVRDAAALALEVLAGELRHGERTIDSIPMFRIG